MKCWHLGLICIVALTLTACKQKQQQAATYELKPYEPLAQMDAPPTTADDTYLADPYATDPMVAPRETTPASETTPVTTAEPLEETLIPTDEPAVRTHVVTKDDTLYKLARHYYNDQRKWRDIWEANRNRLPNPDRLEVGLKLIIP